MKELLTAAAQALEAPEGLVERSARARAAASGASIEDVLAAWSGGGSVVPSAAAAVVEESAPSGPASSGVTAEPAPAAEPEPGPEPAAASEPEPEPGPEPASASEPEPERGPEPAAASEPEPEPDLVKAGVLPRWLVALFVAVPLFAVGYALFLPNGPACGDAGRLAVDPVSGVAVSCDGSEYGSDVEDFYAIGAGKYASICAACHGAHGGGGVGPVFAGGSLLTTFPAGQCEAQVEWVRLGTAGWPEPAYGATGKPVGGAGNMPTFGTAFTETELRSVVLYERVAFGGQDLTETLADCGLEAPGTDDGEG